MIWQTHKAVGRSQKERAASGILVLLCLCLFAPIAGLPVWGADPDLASLCVDRAAIERVYYSHRTGTKPPFEQTLPADALRRLVQTDLAKEAALKKVYGVQVTPAMIAAEVQRINTTTRAPEILAELKAALGNDPNRFACTVAKPIVVERLLRARFENDDKLHAPQRHEAEAIREQLLKKKAGDRRRKTGNDQTGSTSAPTDQLAASLTGILKRASGGQVTETTWQLGARRPETNAPAADEIEVKKRFGPDAKVLSSPHHESEDRKSYFEDLPAELQRVLRVQLRQPGDVSAVIETPTDFLLYVCQAKTPETLAVTTLALSKRSYEEWLAGAKVIP